MIGWLVPGDGYCLRDPKPRSSDTSKNFEDNILHISDNYGMRKKRLMVS